jgi:hypothetical protein
MNEAECERCGKPLEQLPRGRPRRYCTDSCRKAAQRDRDRGAALDRRQAAGLATARAVTARTWRPLEAASMDAADLAGRVLALAAGDDREGLDAAIGELRAATAALASLAEAYFSASQVVAQAPGAALPHDEGTGRLAT